MKLTLPHNREYTIEKHEIMVKVFEEHGESFTTEIVDLF